MVTIGDIIPKYKRCNKCFKLITWTNQQDEKQVLENRIITCPECGENNIIKEEDNNLNLGNNSGSDSGESLIYIGNLGITASFGSYNGYKRYSITSTLEQHNNLVQAYQKGKICYIKLTHDDYYGERTLLLHLTNRTTDNGDVIEFSGSYSKYMGEGSGHFIGIARISMIENNGDLWEKQID